MMRHLLKSNLFASKVHEIVVFLAPTGEGEFVVSHQIQKSTISASTRCTKMIKTAKYSVIRLVFTIKLFMMCRLLKSNFLVVCRFVSSAAVPFALVVL